MTVENAFKLFPEVNEVYKVGSEVFLNSDDADAYAKHFNLDQPVPVQRPAKPEAKTEKKAEVKKTETTDPKADTTDEGADKTDTK